MADVPADLFAFAHAHRDEVVWMSQNTNTIPIDPAIEAAVQDALLSGEYRLYPYRPGVFGLPEAILDDLSLEGYEVFLTNGGIEALYAVQHAFLSPGDEIVATDPSFLPIHHQAEMSGARVVEVPIYGEPWKLTAEGLEDAVTHATRAVLVIDPHNPLGITYTSDELRALTEVAEDRGLLFLHDVTYRDFNEVQNLATRWYPERTLLFYSFSKGPGLAGMRIGGVVGPPGLIAEVKPYDTNVLGVNVLAQRAGLAALARKDEWLPRLRAICRANQDLIQRAVKEVDGTALPVFPSRSNSFIIDLEETGIDPNRLEERMLVDHLVHVRAGDYLSHRFGPNFIRVSFSVPTEACER
ncbi:MAG: pyridoxal phosphate-dependent aminotransferase, partial [Thermoplasmata archaeon]|nr:pyridoxal phosphate-dependent aminotransferase [Thermoplasmata archaeon]